jgi:phosphoribosylaminoimidazole-succinocarboxamide synthase
MSDVVRETNFTDIGIPRRGKVRDVYDLGESLLIVATDRLSAFDVVLPTGIPDKGKVLTKLSVFWFRSMEGIVENHLIELDPEKYPEPARKHVDVLRDRSMLVRKAKVVPFECVVRGYLAGSGWQEYGRSRTVCGIQLPPGLLESSRLERPIFTPATKAEEGHDENVPFATVERVLGSDLARRVMDVSIRMYEKAGRIAEERGIIVADTKFEFGLAGDRLIVVDEVLTPDSSRFWSKNGYTPGKPQDSYDKQIVRDYLNTLDWNKQYPGPELPAEVAERTQRRYVEILEILTGEGL